MHYLTLHASVSEEIEIKRSRFLARVEPVADETSARAVIEAARSEHPKARHHCSAFVLDPDSRTRRFSDDGEPAGTAGAPILEVLTGHGLTYVVAVVTRYFGGTKLGAGGLVRAYGSAVSAALESAVVDRYDLRVPVEVVLDYALAAAVEQMAARQGWKVVGSEYGAEVTLRLAVAPEEVDACLAALADASAGRAEPKLGERLYL